MKIEHWQPQSELTDKEYKNMIGVCRGHQDGDKYKDETCDTHRKNEVLTVNPMDRNTVNQIEYKRDGTIWSSNEAINRDLDKTLNLNCEKALLKVNRKAALKALQGKLNQQQKKGIFNNDLLHKYIAGYEQADENGNKAEYAGILLWYLRKKLHN